MKGNHTLIIGGKFIAPFSSTKEWFKAIYIEYTNTQRSRPGIECTSHIHTYRHTRAGTHTHRDKCVYKKSSQWNVCYCFFHVICFWTPRHVKSHNSSFICLFLNHSLRGCRHVKIPSSVCPTYDHYPSAVRELVSLKGVAVCSKKHAVGSLALLTLHVTQVKRSDQARSTGPPG